MEFQAHPIAYAEWSEKDPAGSFKKFAEFIHGNAKKYLLEDKTHTEIMFFIPLDGKGSLVTLTGTTNDRDVMAEWVRDYIDKHYIFGVVHVCESWVKLSLIHI